jgi:hypothetical protein
MRAWLRQHPQSAGALSALGLSLVAFAIGFAGFELVFRIEKGDSSRFFRERAKCDEAVEALLTSKELVEVTRAGFLIRQLNCSVGRRLP